MSYEIYGELICDGGFLTSIEDFPTEEKAREYGRKILDDRHKAALVKWWDVREKAKEWCTYIVRCKNGSLYTGITNNLQARINKHNSGKGSKACRAAGLPVTLEWATKLKDRSEASKLEYEIKKMTKQQKEFFIKD